MLAKDRVTENQQCLESGCRIRYTVNLKDRYQWIGHHLGDFAPNDPNRIRKVWKRAYRLYRRCGSINLMHIERARLTPEYQSLYRYHDFAIVPDHMKGS